MHYKKSQREVMFTGRSPGCERSKGPIERLNQEIIIYIFY
jgi:hypothetical protein